MEQETAEKQRLWTCAAGRWAAVACFAAAVLPAALSLYKVSRFGWAFPYWDAWHFAEVLERYETGRLTFADLWAQHNEHRLLFPRLIWLVMARLSGWNVGWELALSHGLAGASLVLLLLLARRSLPGAAWVWLAPVFSLLVFSWAQMENFVWGWQSQVFLCHAAIVCGVLCLARGSREGVAAGVACGVLASYSFASGLLYWAVAVPLAFAAGGRSWREALGHGAVVAGGGVLTIASYLFAYHRPEVSPPVLNPAQHAAAFVQFLLLYLGAPITGMLSRPGWHGVSAQVSAWMYLPGLLGLLCFGGLTLRLWLHRKEAHDFQAMLPWLCLGGYAVLSGLVLAAGRAGFGVEQALTSRYIGAGTFFWLAGAALAAQAIGRGAGARGAALPPLLLAGLAVFCALLWRQHAAQAGWEEIARWKQFGWEALRAGHDSPLYLRDLAEHPELLAQQHLPLLRKRHWCGLRETPQRDPARAGAFLAEARRLRGMGLLGQAYVYAETALLLRPGDAEATAFALEVAEAIARKRSAPQAGG